MSVLPTTRYDSSELVTAVLDEEGLQYEVERKLIEKHGESRVFTNVHVHDTFPFELTIYAEGKAHYVFKSSITGKAIERASISELETLLSREYPNLDLEAAVTNSAEQIDRFQLYQSLLLPLENVKQNLKFHPEGDALYHSLQVFDHARDAAGRFLRPSGCRKEQQPGENDRGFRDEPDTADEGPWLHSLCLLWF